MPRPLPPVCQQNLSGLPAECLQNPTTSPASTQPTRSRPRRAQPGSLSPAAPPTGRPLHAVRSRSIRDVTPGDSQVRPLTFRAPALSDLISPDSGLQGLCCSYCGRAFPQTSPEFPDRGLHALCSHHANKGPSPHFPAPRFDFLLHTRPCPIPHLFIAIECGLPEDRNYVLFAVESPAPRTAWNRTGAQKLFLE